MKHCIIIGVLFVFFSCGENVSQESNISSENSPTIEVENENASIEKEVYDGPILEAYTDSLTMLELYNWIEADENQVGIWEVYQNQPEEEYMTWSERLFGRCCTEADLQFSERLHLEVTAFLMDEKYPPEYLTDIRYDKAYVFDEDAPNSIEINLQRKFPWDESGTEKHPTEKLKKEDTLLYPFQISLINGYVKSKKLFYENSRIKMVELWKNGEHMCNVSLLDQPEVQIIEGNFAMLRDDEVEIKPIAFFSGTKFEDVCISEIQTSLGHIAHSSLNKQYSAWD
ncbi:MAG: hypothetical protein MI810_23550 [Flavobacteriales bacterium]|nr:hypothetical protein [Flavobacteriales bacterium]